MQFGEGFVVRTLHPVQQLPVLDVGDMRDEVGRFVEPIEHQHHRHGFGQCAEVTLQPLQRVMVEAIEGLIENQQFRLAGQSSDEHDLAGLPRR